MTWAPAGILICALGPDIGDSLAREKHHLLREHLAGLAVEQTAGANGDRARRRRALLDAAIGAHAGNGSGSAPGSGVGLRRSSRRLRGEGCGKRESEGDQNKLVHRVWRHGSLSVRRDYHSFSQIRAARMGAAAA